MENVKEEVFNSLFEKRVVEYPLSKQGQTVNAYLSFKDGRLANHFEALKNKYGFKRNWLDLQSEYIYQAWEAIQRFEPDTPESWQGILDRTNEHETNKLIKYIKQTVTHKIYEYANPEAFRTTTTQNGKRIHYTLVAEFESLDNLLTNPDENYINNFYQMTDENNLFNTTMYYYYITHFQKWYEENKEDILAPSQLEFLDNLRRCANKPFLTAEDFEKETGTKWADYSRRIRRIENRIEKAWHKRRPHKQSRKQLYNAPRVTFFQEYIDIVNKDTALQAQNLELTNHLIKGMNTADVEHEVFKLIHDTLKGEELVTFNRLLKTNNHRNVPLPGKLLYRITALAEKRLNHYIAEQNSPAPENSIKKAPVRHKKTKKYSPVITYNKDGKVIKTEYKLTKQKTQHKNIFYLLPSGIAVQKD